MDNIIWAAGFLDGEGCISLKRIIRKGRIYHQPYISCSQVIKGRKALEILKKLFSGSITKHPMGGNRVDAIEWRVVSQEALNCAKILLPYFILKKGQAELLIKFYSLVLKREEQYRLTDEDYKKRDELFAQLKKLNVRGKLRLKRLNEMTSKEDATV